MSRNLVLVTGPSRSGKSEWAEELAAQVSDPVIYVATSQLDPTDLEWQARVQRHRDRRPKNWLTQPVPLDLAAAIHTAPAAHCLLVDSLGTWLTNCLDQPEDDWEKTAQTLLASLQSTSNTVILVVEETGWGVVPAYPLGRIFRDRLGHLTRQISAIADTTYLVTAGYALNLSQLGTSLKDTIQR
ncbi:bifunctional adenosylcobinamide kinase/adenosylcobinamide-phosphate guanylyltransferase [Phormidium sp. CLA17]|uniref:bifunctional adenosylcobinamide kinase/adenosylcobinamide-phosphate guanylyltransferase n=1 Tax=Leptolyngbya sp. Cla-17 TaxID=2803751 RepID=UPI00149231EF|nr:bifunctional adenosylcobinamide kinase/adenosylcobinamide-phosphate guanylyltransferase [Leptolyngbya sp. Cla-17]MBM0740455.1 bifunctional adenosylcobinamide kinase/adenosylcobinamide-phosphate guanylyltransferase [Leptolyngbya sp. Cla-17]